MKIETSLNIKIKSADSALKFPANTWGVIKRWGSHSDYEGEIVIYDESENKLRKLSNVFNPSDGECWSNWEQFRKDLEPELFIIEPLPKGTEVTIKITIT